MTPAPNRASGIGKQILLLVLIVLPWVLLFWLGSSGLLVAPPNTSTTLALYAVLMIAGLITLQIPVLQRRANYGERGCLRAVLLLVIGIVMVFIVLALVGPVMGAAIGISMETCPPETVSEGQVQYVCKVSGFTGGIAYTLEGSAGSPFVKIVDEQSYGS